MSPGARARPGTPDDPGERPASISETELVERLQKGQPWACHQLVSQYQNRLLKLVYGITLDPEDSREIVQDIFVKAIKNIREFRREAKLWTWLRRIAVHECLNWKKRWKRRFRWHHRSLETDLEPGSWDESGHEPDPEASLREKQAHARLMKGVAQLSEPLRLVFVLKTFEDLSYEEIAKELKISRGTVSSRLYHARNQLLEAMEK